MFSAQDMRFRCVQPSCAGKAQDALYAHFRDYGIHSMGRVLVPQKRSMGDATTGHL